MFFKLSTKNFLVLILVFSSTLFKISAASAQEQNNSHLRDQRVLSAEIFSMSGTSLEGYLDHEISSDTAIEGDEGYLVLASNTSELPAGTKFKFVVTKVNPASRSFNKPGELELKVVEVLHPSGTSARIEGDAYIVKGTNEEDTILRGSTKLKRFSKVGGTVLLSSAVGAGLAVIGSNASKGIKNLGRSTGNIINGKWVPHGTPPYSAGGDIIIPGGIGQNSGSHKSGSSVEGLIAGAVTGAIIGIAISSQDKGKEVIIKSGSVVKIVFPQGSHLVVHKGEQEL